MFLRFSRHRYTSMRPSCSWRGLTGYLRGISIVLSFWLLDGSEARDTAYEITLWWAVESMTPSTRKCTRSNMSIAGDEKSYCAYWRWEPRLWSCSVQHLLGSHNVIKWHPVHCPRRWTAATESWDVFHAVMKVDLNSIDLVHLKQALIHYLQSSSRLRSAPWR